MTLAACFASALILTLLCADSGEGVSWYAGPAVVAWIVTARETARSLP